MFKRILFGILFALLFALGLWGAIWVISLLLLTQPSDAVMTPAIIIGFFAVFILYLVKPRIGKGVALAAAVAATAGIVINLAVIMLYLPSADYEEVDTGKAALYGDRRVMIIVPHQDDEINLAGGVIEKYLRYGSEVYVVYTTNGDVSVPAEQRLNEGINALGVLGVDEEHIIFLGYGDFCTDEDGTPLYNTTELAKSFAGYSATYALADHPPFREGREYTRQSFLEDVQAVILQYKPDVIYSVGCDKHPDHVLTALLSDRAIGLILAQSEYKPQVFKGYAYSTSYYGTKNPFLVNIRQTQNPGEELNLLAPGLHDWDKRIRMPVSAGSLSRIAESSRLYKAAREHRSQDEVERYEQVITGDKVFWERETTSLCYSAKVSASSGDAQLFTDFVLADTTNAKSLPGTVTGVWHPDKSDDKQSISIEFDTPQNIARIKLYDDPSPDANITSALLRLDNGTTVDIGALNALGSATEIQVGAENVRSMTLEIKEYTGDLPGLTELEVFSDEYAAAANFIKLMNGEGDFVYDYHLDPSGTGSFDIYTCGDAASGRDYSIECVGEDCSAVMQNGRVTVTCPAGKSCVVTVSDGVYSDTALFRNSGRDKMPYVIRLCAHEHNALTNIRLLFQNEQNRKLMAYRFFENTRWELTAKLKQARWAIGYAWDKVF